MYQNMGECNTFLELYWPYYQQLTKDVYFLNARVEKGVIFRMKPNLLLALALATLTLSGCGSPEQPPAATVRLVEHQAVMDGTFLESVDGRIKNESSRTLRFVSVEFGVYTEDGKTLIGNATDSVTNLEPGKDWWFSAPSPKYGRKASLSKITAF
jgi:hypothetical protein